MKSLNLIFALNFVLFMLGFPSRVAPPVQVAPFAPQAPLFTCSAPAGYYDSATNKTGVALRKALHDIVTNAVVIPYSSTAFDTEQALDRIDQDPANTNNVIEIYSGVSVAKTNFGTVSGWEREHLWPNSYGIDSSGPSYSDLHNLRPIDSTVNSSRGNKFYDNSNTNDANYHNPAHVEAPLCTSDTDSWEPPDSMKGDIARALFYMDVRYEGDRNNERNLVLTANTALINSATNFMGNLSTLLRWNALDPVDEAECQRNAAVYSLQGNRNPFVDHPEWVDLIFKPILHIQPSTNALMLLSWSAVFSNAVPQSSTLNGVWTTVTNSPVIASNSVYLTQPSTATNRFYRLLQLP